MSVINSIANSFEQAEIHWVVRSDVAQILSMDQRIKVWSFDRQDGLQGLIRLGKKLQAEKFDYIYDAHCNLRSAILRRILSRKSSARVAIRPKKRFQRFLLFKLGINRFPRPFLGMMSYWGPLRSWLVERTSFQLSPFFSSEIASKVASYFSDKTITLAPSANWEMKRWPLDYWKELIEKLADYQFIILGGERDLFCQELVGVAPARVINLAGKLSLLESCAAIFYSKLVISADTGLIHVADLLNIRGILLLGPTAFGRTSGEQIRVLETEIGCRPCSKDGRGKCKQDVYQKCLIEITPRMVANEVKKIF